MSKRKARRLNLEALEAREVPAVFASTTGAIFQVSQPLIQVIQQPTTFTDDFAGSSSLGAQWQGRVGSFVASGAKAIAAAGGTSITTLQSVSARDAVVQADIAIRAGSGESVGLVARYSGAGEQNFYLAEAYGTPGAVTLSIYRNHAGNYTRLAFTQVADAAGALRFEADGPSFRLYLNGELKVSAADTLLDGAGTVGVRANAPRNVVSLDNFSFERLATPNATLGTTDAFSAARLRREYVTQVGDVRVSGGQASNATGTALATLRGVAQRDQVVGADVAVAARSGASVGLVARYSGPGENNFYLAEVYADPRSAAVRVSIYLRQGNAYRLLASDTVAGGVTGRLTFEAVGSSQRVYLGDRYLVSSLDSTLDGAGSAGFRLNGAAGAARIDNFSADVPAAAPAPFPFTDGFLSAGRLDKTYTEKAGAFTVSGGAVRNATGLSVAVANGIDRGDMTVKAGVSLTPGSGQSVGLLGRYTGEGEGNGYLAEMYAAPGMGYSVAINLYRRFGGVLTRLGTVTSRESEGTLGLTLFGPSLAVTLNGQTVLSVRDTLLVRGTAGLRLSGPAGGVAAYNFAAEVATAAPPPPDLSSPSTVSPYTPAATTIQGIMGGIREGAKGAHESYFYYVRHFDVTFPYLVGTGASVTQVAFYHDTDGDGFIDAASDPLLGNGMPLPASANGPTWRLTVRTADWGPGTYRVLAQATDSNGLRSRPTSVTFQI